VCRICSRPVVEHEYSRLLRPRSWKSAWRTKALQSFMCATLSCVETLHCVACRRSLAVCKDFDLSTLTRYQLCPGTFTAADPPRTFSHTIRHLYSRPSTHTGATYSRLSILSHSRIFVSCNLMSRIFSLRATTLDVKLRQQFARRAEQEL